MTRVALVAFAVTASCLFANPYPDPKKVPQDRIFDLPSDPGTRVSIDTLRAQGKKTIRVIVGWSAEGEKYQILSAVIEQSGTEALEQRAKKPDAIGSYRATLSDSKSGKKIAFATIGTGAEFRKLSRAMAFRFPLTDEMAAVLFQMTAENPKSGIQAEVISVPLDLRKLPPAKLIPKNELEVRRLKEATLKPSLELVIYSEGYLASRQDQFWKDAQKIFEVLKDEEFPELEHLSLTAVFSASHEKIGRPKDLGLPLPERKTFLGLYYPYWEKFGRWYNVVYPTSEIKYRDAIGQVPYDYPIALVDNNVYFGVGNLNELTAIPVRDSNVAYLLTHEFGHFFGLNEEYESGGPTELAFAPGIKEPWSQNITFLGDPTKLKWKAFVDDETPVPTPEDLWTGNEPLGAYKGGYAETPPLNKSHKPGKNCVMESSAHFCDVCRQAITERLRKDWGE